MRRHLIGFAVAVLAATMVARAQAPAPTVPDITIAKDADLKARVCLNDPCADALTLAELRALVHSRPQIVQALSSLDQQVKGVRAELDKTTKACTPLLVRQANGDLFDAAGAITLVQKKNPSYTIAADGTITPKTPSAGKGGNDQ